MVAVQQFRWGCVQSLFGVSVLVWALVIVASNAHCPRAMAEEPKAGAHSLETRELETRKQKHGHANVDHATQSREHSARNPTMLEKLGRYEVHSVQLPTTAGVALNIDVPIDGLTRRLRLTPHSARSPKEFTVLVQGEDGRLRSVLPPNPRTYRGEVEGMEGSKVAAQMSGGRLTARVRSADGDLWQVEPLSRFVEGAAFNQHVIYRPDELPELEMGCGTPDGHVGQAGFHMLSERSLGGVASGFSFPKVADIAFDADREFFVKNNSSVADTVHDIEDIMNQVAMIYEDQLNITFEITTIIVRTAETDPYSDTQFEALLDQMEFEWNVNQGGVHRDIAHLMTGKDIDSNVIGAAHPGTICEVCGTAKGYGFSESRFTNNMAQRVTLTAHELGHNFGAMHCNDPSLPSPDPDCAIMCRTIGGCTGNLTEFGNRSITAINNEVVAADCLATLAPPLDLPFCDPFDGEIDEARWSYNKVASLSQLGISPPSPLFSLLIDTCCTSCSPTALDDIRTNFIHLADVPSATLSFHTQHQGGLATDGSELIVDYFSMTGTWVELDRIVSNGTSQTAFVFHSYELPADAYHDEFRIRFHIESVVDQANWFIDDVSISEASPDQPVLYVRQDAPASGNGASWATAFNNLQEALSIATCARGVVDEIWVAQGTYKPDSGSGDRTATFQLANDLALYGGFEGTELLRIHRDPIAHPTVFSGEIGFPSNAADNSYHVVTAEGTDQTALLSGFVIRDGNASGTDPNDGGGGLLANLGGSPAIDQCLFINNGGKYGGAVRTIVGSNPKFTDCTFKDNLATLSGGAFHVSSNTSPTLDRCRFWGNGTAFSGGALFNSAGLVTVTNTLFSGNAATSGGAIQNHQGTVKVTNCTLSHNTASSLGGGIVNNGNTVITNCILWDNQSPNVPEVRQLAGPFFPTINHSIVQGWSGVMGGNGNNGDDPLFVDADGADDMFGTDDDDTRVPFGSSAIDSGDPSVLPAWATRDLEGFARVLCTQIDRGAYEFGIGDPDCNDVIELSDFANFPSCMTAPHSDAISPGCEVFDLDGDSDVDLDDYRAFSNSMD